MVVRELITRLGFKLNTGQLDKAQQATEKLKDRANSAASAFRNIAVAMASVASVRAVVNMADQMQNIRSRIGMLPQTIGEAADAFDAVSKHASDTGMSIDAYSSLYTRVGNAAKDYIKTQEDLLGITDTISQALVVGGASAQEASAVMTQFSQALASGVLQGDEFRSMAEAAPQYLDKLSEAMNIPREQLKKMASDGKLTAKAVIEATRSMSGYFGEKFKEMPMTVGRAMTVISNKFGSMIDRLNRKTLIIPKLANLMVEAFNKIEIGIGKLVDAFGGWNNLLRLIGVTIGVAFGAKAIGILMAFRAVAWTAALPFLKMAAIIGLVTLAIDDLMVWVGGGKSLTGTLIGPWSEWKDYVLGAFEAVKAVFVWLGTMIGTIAALHVGVFTQDWSLFKEALKGMGDLLWQIVGQWGTWLFEAFKYNLNLVLDTAYKIFETMANAIYKAVFEPIVRAVSDAWDSVKNIGDSAWQGAKSLVGMEDNSVAPAGNRVGLGSVTPLSMAQTRPNINANTTVNVTVPPGTPQDQAAFLHQSAQQSYNQLTGDKFARNISVYAQ